jgi:hypothetical protein
LKRFDIIIIAAILVIAVSSLAVMTAVRNTRTDEARYAEIYMDGELYSTVPLDEDSDFVIETGNGYNRVVVEDGSVRIAEADCSSQTCVHSGRQVLPGSMIACLPHRLVIKVTGRAGGGETEIDAIAY